MLSPARPNSLLPAHGLCSRRALHTRVPTCVILLLLLHAGVKRPHRWHRCSPAASHTRPAPHTCHTHFPGHPLPNTHSRHSLHTQNGKSPPAVAGHRVLWPQGVTLHPLPTRPALGACTHPAQPASSPVPTLPSLSPATSAHTHPPPPHAACLPTNTCAPRATRLLPPRARVTPGPAPWRRGRPARTLPSPHGHRGPKLQLAPRQRETAPTPWLWRVPCMMAGTHPSQGPQCQGAQPHTELCQPPACPADAGDVAPLLTDAAKAPALSPSTPCP